MPWKGSTGSVAIGRGIEVEGLQSVEDYASLSMAVPPESGFVPVPPSAANPFLAAREKSDTSPTTPTSPANHWNSEGQASAFSFVASPAASNGAAAAEAKQASDAFKQYLQMEFNLLQLKIMAEYQDQVNQLLQTRRDPPVHSRPTSNESADFLHRSISEPQSKISPTSARSFDRTGLTIQTEATRSIMPNSSQPLKSILSPKGTRKGSNGSGKMFPRSADDERLSEVPKEHTPRGNIGFRGIGIKWLSGENTDNDTVKRDYDEACWAGETQGQITDILSRQVSVRERDMFGRQLTGSDRTELTVLSASAQKLDDIQSGDGDDTPSPNLKTVNARSIMSNAAAAPGIYLNDMRLTPPADPGYTSHASRPQECPIRLKTGQSSCSLGENQMSRGHKNVRASTILRGTIEELARDGKKKRSASSWSRIVAFCRCVSVMEPRHLDFNKLCRQRYGNTNHQWNELPIGDQVEIIRDALKQKTILIDPDSEYMKCFDIILMGCLLFTGIVTPFEISFLPFEHNSLYVMNKVVDAIFFKEMVMQFFLKVRKETQQGTIWIKRRRSLMTNYFSTWFLVDLLSILPYDDIASSFANKERKQVRWVRLIRVCRLAKLVRMLKASKIVKRWTHRVGLSSVQRQLAFFGILILGSVHWFACIWGCLGRQDAGDVQCRGDLSLDDPRLVEYPQAQYFFEDTSSRHLSSPSDWQGVSWFVNWVNSRVLGTAIDPCGPWPIYVVSMYWAIMTLTSIGYGDILPVTFLEYLVCNICMLGSSILWAYIISAACAVMSNMDPEQKEADQQMDAFNAMAKDRKLPGIIKSRGREFIRAERYHRHYLRNHEAVAALGKNLRSTVCRRMAENYLDNIWIFARTGVQFRDATADAMVPHFYESKSLIELFGNMCVVERGAVGRLGKILVPWSYWGDDMIVRAGVLHSQVPSIALSHCEIVTLLRSDLCRILEDYPEEVPGFRRAAVLVAIRRIAEIHKDGLSGCEINLKLRWVAELFIKLRQRNFKRPVPNNFGQAPVFGDRPNTVDERLDVIATGVRRFFINQTPASPTEGGRRQSVTSIGSFPRGWTPGF